LKKVSVARKTKDELTKITGYEIVAEKLLAWAGNEKLF
jgi:hypothetical protein